MIEEALRFLHDSFQPQAIEQRQFIGPDGRRSERQYLLIDGDSVSVANFAQRDSRNHNVARLIDFVDIVNKHGGENSSIWISSSKIVAHLFDSWHDTTIKGDADTLDRVTLNLNGSAFFDGLKSAGLGGKQTKQQKDFLTLLRRGLGPENAQRYAETGLIGKAQNLRFLTATEGASVIGKGKDTMSVTVDKQLVARDGELPDYFEATGPLFKNFDLTALTTVQVQVALDTDPDERKFITEVDAIGYEGELNRVLEAIRAEVANGIETESVGIYLGTP
jgi:hypothetical protein